MFPIRDHNPSGRTPFVVYALMAANILIFLSQMLLPMVRAMPVASWILAAEVFYLGAFGVHHFERSYGETETPAQRRSGVPATLDADTDRLLAHMKDARPWLTPGLTLAELSASSGFAEATLTDAIQHAGYAHFFDFVNAHRCAAVQTRLRQQDGSDTSILDLALEHGFNSKTAFNRVFKAQTGLTPSQYRDQTAE